METHLFTLPALEDATNIQGRTCLHELMFGAHGILENVIQHGGRVNAVDEMGCTPLHLAVHANDKMLSKALLKHGGDSEAVNYEGSTPLHLGCWSGSYDAVSVLIDQGR